MCDCGLACRGQKRVFKCASFHSRLQGLALRFMGQIFLPTKPLSAPEFISWGEKLDFFFGNFFFPSLSFWSYFYLLEFVRYSCLIFPSIVLVDLSQCGLFHQTHTLGVECRYFSGGRYVNIHFVEFYQSFLTELNQPPVLWACACGLCWDPVTRVTLSLC